MKPEKQKRFYQRDKVDWWNFWFESHVLRRDILGKLLDSTNAALSGLANKTIERISVVAIYHQPDSGGTTIAKNVLWELKEQHRCAIVKTITSETSDQVSRLFKEGEPSNPKSVLLLLDNFDEMKVRKVKASFENEPKNLSREVEIHHLYHLYCSFAYVVRLNLVHLKRYVIIDITLNITSVQGNFRG